MDVENRILHIVDGLNPKLGGVAKAVESIAFGLAELGVKNDILTLDDEIFVNFNNAKIHVFTIGSGKGPWNFNPNLKIWLKKNASNYHILIIHGLWLYKNYCVWNLFYNSSHLKFYVMPHGMLDPYFQKTDTRKLKSLRNELYWKFIEGKIINSATGLLFTCKEEMLLAHTTFPKYKPKREHIVSLGISDPLAMLKDQNLKNNSSNYYLFLSRIHEKKGLGLFSLLLPVYVSPPYVG